MVDLAELLHDLSDESAEVDALVAPLSDADWQRPTPAPGWSTVRRWSGCPSGRRSPTASVPTPLRAR